MRALPWLLLVSCMVPPASSSGPVPAAAPAGAPGSGSGTAASTPAAQAALEPLDLQLDDPQSKQCQTVDRAIDAWQRIENAYVAVYPDAAKNGWQGSKYDDAVKAYLASHSPGTVGGSDGPPDAQTDMCTCQTTGIDAACAWFASHGLPAALCEAEKAHEQVHAQECRANQHRAPSDPDFYRCVNGYAEYSAKQRELQELAAYDATLKVLDDWYQHHCLSGCKQMADAGAWAGAMFITYTRTNRTNYTDEQLHGSASYRISVEKVQFGVGVNGYDVTWEGKAIGRGQFDDVEQHLDGTGTYEGHGGGPLLDNPHGVDFGPEILRIDPKKCLYAFETFAAIDSSWNHGHDQHPESLHVQLGNFAIGKHARTLEGSQTLSLPVSHFDWPGPAARLPNDPIDWRARGRIGGSVTITWRFAPLRR